MGTALDRGAAALPPSQAPRVRLPVAGLLLAGLGVALVLAAVLFGGGSGAGRLVWIGGAAIVVASLAAAAALAGWIETPRVSRAGAVFLALLAALVLWNGLSVLWSIQPDRSWDYLNRGLVYLAFAVLGVFVGGLVPRPARSVAAGLAVVLAAALGWALLGKAAPSLFPDGARIARLRSPVGYWNALALLGDMALPLGLWLAAPRRRQAWLRAAGVALLYGAMVAIVLTYSRGGVAVGVLAILLWLAVSGPRLEGVSAAGLAAAGAGLVSLWAFSRPGLVKDGQPYTQRLHDGAWFAGAFVLGLAVVFGVAWVAAHWERRRPLGEARRRLLGWVAIGAVAVVCVGAFAAVSVRAGGPGEWVHRRWVEFARPAQITQGQGHLGTLSSNNRWAWWQEAWHTFLDKPLKGSGAGSFELDHLQRRTDALGATEPHNLALQFMAELGVVGVLLAGGAAAAALWAGVAAVRRLDGAEQAAAAALFVVLPVYLVHGLADFDWDFVAVTGPLFLVAGTLTAAGLGVRARPQRRSLALMPAAGLVVVVAVAALYSLGAPWLASRRVDAAYVAIDRSDFAAAVAKSRSAARLNPYSLDPLYAWALADELSGDRAGAYGRYVKAVEVQPDNAATWYALGEFEFLVLKDHRAAYVHLNHAYTLDPHGPAGEPGGLLDRARAIVNAGGR